LSPTTGAAPLRLEPAAHVGVETDEAARLEQLPHTLERIATVSVGKPYIR
jgi:hypothetical protein